MSGKPVTFAPGAKPVTAVDFGGIPVSAVDVGGQPMTLVDVGGMPIIIVSGGAPTASYDAGGVLFTYTGSLDVDYDEDGILVNGARIFLDPGTYTSVPEGFGGTVPA